MSLTPAQRREVQAMIAQYGANKRGIIIGYQAQPPRVKVQIMPPPDPPDVPVETGWIPYLSGATGLEGNGWGIVTPPQARQQVLLICEEGDGQNYTAWGGYYSNVDGAPQGAAPGEIMLGHQSGSRVWLKTDGSLSFISATVNIEGPNGGDATVNITGNLVASGTVKGSDLITPVLSSVNQHTHTSETPGQPTSAPISGT